MARDAVSKLCLLIMQATLKMPIDGPAWRNVPNTTAQSDEVPHHQAPAALLFIPVWLLPPCSTLAAQGVRIYVDVIGYNWIRDQ